MSILTTLHFPLEILAVLMLVGFCAGFIDSIAGGGGLLALPALLAVGMPPVVALATNKFQGAVGEFSSILQYRKHGKLDLKRLKLGLIAVLIGASAGAILVQLIHPEILKKLIPILLLLVLIYFLKPKRASNKPKNSKVSAPLYFTLAGLLIGFYNGFFGPATGTIWTASLMFFLAYDLREAIVYAKPLNMAGNIFSLIWFIAAGKVYYPAAICMSVGTFIGGRTGARFVIFRDIRLVKLILLTAVTLMTIGLFYKYY